MWMTEEQIQASYRDARFKKDQIEILAQLNDCCTEQICDIIGVSYKKTKGRIRTGRKSQWTPEKESTLKAMFENGASDDEISAAIGIVVSSVVKKRTELDLRRRNKRLWKRSIF